MTNQNDGLDVAIYILANLNKIVNGGHNACFFGIISQCFHGFCQQQRYDWFLSLSAKKLCEASEKIPIFILTTAIVCPNPDIVVFEFMD